MAVRQDQLAEGQAQVSIIIPHFNDVERLQACVDRLHPQVMKHGNAEIIVADNGSDVGFERLASILADRCRIVQQPVRGAGPARNAGVAASNGRLLAFIDSDCLPEPEWLSRGLAALARFDVVGGCVRVLVPDAHAPTPAEAFELVFAFQNQYYVEHLRFSVTASLFTSRAVFDAVGPFEVGIPEDVDWCRRAGAAGYSLGYANDAVIWHPARRDWRELHRKWARLMQESSNFAMRKPWGRIEIVARAIGIIFLLGPRLLRIARSPALPNLKARLGAALVLVRLTTFRVVSALRFAALGR